MRVMTFDGSECSRVMRNGNLECIACIVLRPG